MTTLREMRKASLKKRYKTYISLSNSAHDALIKLIEQEPELYISQIISHAVRDFAERGGFRKPEPVETTAPVKRYESVKDVHAKKVTELVKLYGGEVVNGTCSYTQYQSNMTGTIIKLDQSLGVQQMPSDPDSVRKLILGSFATIAQAEFEYQKQKKIHEEPDKIIKADKK